MTLIITTLRISILSAIMPNVIMLSVIMPSVVMLNVMATARGHCNVDKLVSLALLKQGLG